MKEDINPKINPAEGVKRINKLPLIIFFSIAGLVLVIMLTGIMGKSKKQNVIGEVEEPDEEMIITNDRASLENIMGGIKHGYEPIVSAPQASPKESEGAQTQEPSKDSIDPRLLARLEQLEAANKVQNEEIEKMKKEEALAVADSPLVIDLGAFKARIEAMKEKAAVSPKNGSGGIQVVNGVLPPLSTADALEAIQSDFTEDSVVFAYENRKEDPQVILPFRVQPQASPLELKAGSIIPMTFISGINSDLEGNVIAQVNSNVFDTVNGDYLLVPQGTRVFGSYNASNIIGADRVAVIWNRLIFPNGESLSIESVSGSDVEGYAGAKDKVNNHYRRIFGSAILLSGVTASVAIAADDNDNDDGDSAGSTATDEVALNLGRVMTEKLSQDINIEPTIEIRPGMKGIIMVNKDMTFEKPYEQHINYDELYHPNDIITVHDPRKGVDPRSSKATIPTAISHAK